MPKWLTFGLLILLLLLLASFPLAKQLEPETGSIQGVIRDQVGPLPQALVEARNLATSAISYAESNGTGVYRLDDLHPGRYSLWVQARFHDSLWIKQVPVDRGQTVHQDIFLNAIATQTRNLPTDNPSQRASR